MSGELCACGRALHYLDPGAEHTVRHLVALHGPTVAVSCPEGAWRVPRHYIALHGLRAEDLALLADLYGWERLP